VYNDAVATTKRRTHNRTASPLRAITYGRVSTGKQANTGVSLGDQADTLATIVAQRGWAHVDHVVDAGMSGRKMDNRPGLVAALDRLDRGDADVLIDRLSRSTEDFAKLLNRSERKGWAIVVLDCDVDTTTAAGRLVVDVVNAAAQFESRRIGERVKAVHAVRRAQGKRAGEPPRLPGELRHRISAERAAGLSLTGIAERLNAEGVRSAKGGRWYASTVAHVVRSVALDEELVRSSPGEVGISHQGGKEDDGAIAPRSTTFPDVRQVRAR
jgi:DNA invertase Pin-like site-specific DNA recombinase